MDITRWPMTKIMQLPDSCFGRRFVVSVCARSEVAVPVWDISEVGLPERCVLWELVFWPSYANYKIDYFRLALGNKLPTTVAMMNGFEPLIPGLGVQGAEPRQIWASYISTVSLARLRVPIASRGRRLVMELVSLIPNKADLIVAITVSSIPTEVPDWLVAGKQGEVPGVTQ